MPPNAVQHANIDDGEFWMELKDFIKYFTGVTICSLVPDFDKDGCADTLSKFLLSKYLEQFIFMYIFACRVIYIINKVHSLVAILVFL